MELSDKLDRLALRLSEMTASGKIKWEETADEEASLVVIGKSSVTVREYHNTYELALRDENGRLLESVESLYLEQASQLRSNLIALHTAAKRSARGTDRALEDVFAALDKIA
jgi:hypothetical protein